MFEHAQTEGMQLLRVHGGHLAVQAVALLKHQIFAQHDAHQCANRIKRLADIEPQRGVFTTANH